MRSSALFDPRASARAPWMPARETIGLPAWRSASHAAEYPAGGALRHSTAWEDHLLVERALGAAGGGEVLVVAGAGCTVLNLLVRAPRRVVAIDINPAQTALLGLKLAAARRLPHDAFLRLLGVRDAERDPGVDRLALYERVRPLLSRAARAWWDAHEDVIVAGPDGAGRLDRHAAAFRREHLERLTSPGVVDRLLATDDPGARARLADAALFTPAFARAFRAHFASETGDGAGWLLRRLRRTCTELPVRDNCYLARFLLGGLRDPEAGPPYLRRAAFERLRALAPRVDIVTDEVGHYLASRPVASLHGAALSGVLGDLAPHASARLLGEVARVLRPRGRVAYWTAGGPRAHPAAPHARLRPLDRLSQALARRDRGWWHGGFHVGEAVGRAGPTNA